MPLIDAHVHLIPDAYRDTLAERGFDRYPMPPWSREGTLAFMDRHGIDAAVMSVSPPGVYFGDQGFANELAKICNTETAELVRSDPSRFAGLAHLPLPDPQAALDEIPHAFDELGLDGVILLTNVAGTYLGDPSWDPVFEELDRRGAYVFVHPIEPATELPMPSIPVWVQEFPFDTTRAVVQMIYNGIFERFPRIRMQLAHMGGTTPFIAHRIASLTAREPDRADAAPAGALEYLSRLYYDTGLANNEIALRATLGVAPADHVLFGTDWPYADLPESGPPAPGLDGDALTAEERASVDGTNVAALVPRFGDLA